MLTENKKLGYNKKEVQSMLNIPSKSINRLLKEGKLTYTLERKRNSLISVDSIIEYKKELDERKSMGKPVWINRNDG